MNASNFELLATVLFALSILHTFSVKYFLKIAHRYSRNIFWNRFFHFMAEIEVVFGLWAGLFVLLCTLVFGTNLIVDYMETRNFTEPLFVFAIMTICSTKPIIDLARLIIGHFSNSLPLQRDKAFYLSCLVVGPLLGSFITEPAAMTVTALLLKDRFFPGTSDKFKYTTLGVLFVNVSIGGVLTPFAAPPVLMVANKWGWDLSFMLTHFGHKAVLAVFINALIATFYLKNHFKISSESTISRAPTWLKTVHIIFLVGLVLTSHHTSLFMGVFIFFLGITNITRDLQDPLKLREGLLVGFFLAGLVVFGGLQTWWLEPILRSLSDTALYLGAAALTAITDNAALTFLGSQIDQVTESYKYFLVAGAVAGGGLTVIANAPNPAGASILGSNFGGVINPIKLLVAALLPTSVALICFYFLPNL